MAKKASKRPAKKAAKKSSKKSAKKPARKKMSMKASSRKSPAKKKARRTTHRSSSGKKLYAVRSAGGQFKDIQTYERAHGADIQRDSASERAAETLAHAEVQQPPQPAGTM
jgi:hypothetical protein